jgi:hypothetical protein
MKQGIKNGRYGYPKGKENNMKPREIKLYWKEQKDTAPTIEPNTEFDTDIKKMAKDQRSRRTEVSVFYKNNSVTIKAIP